MSAAEIGLLITAVSGVLLGIWSIVRGMRSDKTNEVKVAAEVQHSVVDDYLKLDQRVAEIVDEKVANALEPMKKQLAASEERASQVEAREQKRTWAIAEAFRSLFEQWNQPDPPRFPRPVVEALENTMPPDWVRGGAPKRP